MSVIHQMLRDLDARGASSEAALQRLAQAMPQTGPQRRAQARRSLPIVAVSVACLLAAGAVVGSRPERPPSPRALDAVIANDVQAVPAGQSVHAGQSMQMPEALTQPPSPSPMAPAAMQLAVAAPTPATVSEDPIAPASPTPETRRTAAAKPPPGQPRPAASTGPGPSDATATAPEPAAAASADPEKAAANQPVAVGGIDAAAAIAAVAAQAPLPAPARIERRSSMPTASDSAESLHRSALARYQAGDTGQALALLERALALDADHAGARRALVAMQMGRGDLDAARRTLAVGLARDPRQHELAELAARLAMQAGDTEAAARILRQAASVDAPATLHASLAGLMAQSRRDREAVPHWIAALERDATQPHWWLGLALALEADRRPDDAGAAYERALAIGGLREDAAEFARGRLAQLARR